MAPTSSQARAHSHRTWAMTPDRAARTAPGRAAFLARFEREVDPDGILDPRERAIRAENARKAYFIDLSAKANAAKRIKAGLAASKGLASSDSPRVVPAGDLEQDVA